MAINCQNCTEKCPQAEMAHNAALGRMYATNELVSILKKVESGKLVEVVRCKDCIYYEETFGKDSGKPCGYGRCGCTCQIITGIVYDEDFCSYGERKDNQNA